MRFTVLNPLTILLGVLLLVFIVIPLLPILLVFVLFFLLFGRRSAGLRSQYERFRDSRFYGNMDQAKHQQKKDADDPDVCDVECTVISSETIDDDKKN